MEDMTKEDILQMIETVEQSRGITPDEEIDKQVEEYRKQ